MSAFLLIAPAIEPLSLGEAKLFLRVEHGDDDAVIAALVAAARAHIEALTRRCLITQTWRHVRDAWPADGRIRLRLGPIRSIAAVRQFDAAGNAGVGGAVAAGSAVLAWAPDVATAAAIVVLTALGVVGVVVAWRWWRRRREEAPVTPILGKGDFA